MADLITIQRPTFASSLAQGIEAMGGLAVNRQRSALMRQQVQQQDKYAKAVDEYGKTGDPEVFKGADPEAYMKITAWKDSQPPEDIKGIMKATDYIASIRGAINPQTWPGIKQSLEKQGLVKPGMLPDEMDDAKINQFAYAGKLIGAQIKAQGAGGLTSVPASGTVINKQGQVVYKAPPATETIYHADQLTQGQVIPKDSKIIPQQKGFKPERFVPKEGEGQGVWVTPGEAVPEGYVSEKEKSAKSSELDLTPEAIDAMAGRYMLDGTMPGLGLGKAATKARSLVMNKVAEKMTQEGQTPQSLVTNKVVVGGLQSEAKRLLGQRGPMLAFAQTADKNLSIAEGLSGKVGRTGAPVINRWLLAGKREVAGDPDVSAFNAAVQVAVNEFAKVTSSATGGGVTSDQARKDIEGILNSAQNPEQFKAVVTTLRSDMKNRIDSYETQLQNIQKAAQGVGTQAGGGSPPTAAQVNQAVLRTQRIKNKQGQDVTDQLTDEQYKAVVEHHSQ